MLCSPHHSILQEFRSSMKTKYIFLITSPYLHNYAYCSVVWSAPQRCSLPVSTLLRARGVSPTHPRLCLVVGFSKWKGQQETGGLDWSEAEVEVCIALPRLQALSHLSSQGNPFHGTGGHPSPHPARPSFPLFPTVTGPSPSPDTPSLGSPYICSHFGKEPWQESLAASFHLRECQLYPARTLTNSLWV